MLDIIALGDYRCAIEDELAPPNLRAELKLLCRERFRRIDRFTELCLLGSARCMYSSPEALQARAGIYLGSGFAGIANTVAVQQQLFCEGLIPRPANFINTLSNSAGYFIARNLQFQGQNMFVSRGSASLVAALQLAAMELEAGIVSQALVGVADECDRRPDFHRRRQSLPEAAPLAEGSHWFLLRSAATPCNLARGRFRALATLADAPALGLWLQRHRESFSHIYLAADAFAAQTVAEEAVPGFTALDAQPYDIALGHYPSRTGAVLTTWLQQAAGAGLVTVNGDAQGRYHLSLLQAGPQAAPQA